MGSPMGVSALTKPPELKIAHDSARTGSGGTVDLDANWKDLAAGKNGVTSSLTDGESGANSASGAVAQGTINDGDTTDEADFLNKKVYALAAGIGMNVTPFVAADAATVAGLARAARPRAEP